MFRRLLHLEPGQLSRALPFFCLYLLLFAALSLLDGLSLALFLKQVGTARLPLVYSVAAAGVFLAVAAYMVSAERFDTGTVFAAIILVPAIALVVALTALASGGSRLEWLGAVFICREVGMTMVLLHFGNFLRDFFPQSDLARIMPFVYAGGRLGSLAGGSILEWMSGPVGLEPLLGVVVLLFVAATGVMLAIRRRYSLVADARNTVTSVAPVSLRDFARLVFTDPLLWWITISTIAYFACRTFVLFRYSGFFEEAFPDEVALSAFLGRYVQVATLASVVIQLVLAARGIGWVGLGTAHATYGLLMALAAALVAMPVTLTTAVFARFVEVELRYSLRNPVSQLTVNLFPRPIRLRARAWSLGLLIPVSTFAASVAIAALQRAGLPAAVGGTTAILGVGYFLATLGLRRTLGRRDDTNS